MTLKFLANIKNLKISGLDNQMLWEKYRQTLKNTVEVIVKQPKALRSLRQNRYYWGVVVEILCEYTGYSREETHEILKAKFLSDTKKVGNEIITYARSTTTLTTKEFENYLQRIREWAIIELQVNIPDPETIVLEDL